MSITFPVLRSIAVKNYEIFPGQDDGGISHSFLPGVTVIAGINGLGKTTLLNMILRVLIGPRDVVREDPNEPGFRKHKLMNWRSPKYFRQRVSDAAAEATVDATISFGDTTLRIVRSLNNLEIITLESNGTSVEPSIDKYEALICQLAGVGSFYDFHFLVRNLVFFLEDRRALVWSEEGQFEIFRILFLDSKVATKFGALYDAIQKIDSRSRSLLTEVNRNEKQLKQNLAAVGQESSTQALISDLQTQFTSISEREETLTDRINELLNDKRDLIAKIEQSKLDLEEARREYEGSQQRYFSQAFPGLNDTVQYLFAHLVSEGGCLVCGNRETDAAERIRELASNGQCPVCESLPDQQENVVSGPKVNAARLQKLFLTIQKKVVAHRHLEREKSDLENSLRDLVASRTEALKDQEKISDELRKNKGKLPTDDESTRELQSAVNVGRKRLNEYKAERETLAQEYSGLLENARLYVETLSEQIKTQFQFFAGHFLAEECELSFGVAKKPIGQSGVRYDYPNFSVLMTSGVFSNSPRERSERDQVSESQMEFIDLAFRMALMAVAIQKSGNAMLVLETPEASLDSLFVGRAGELLRNFAGGHGEHENVLIASSNLNNENMIPALLGLNDSKPSSKKERVSRIINLLELAAPSAALRKDREHYAEAYKKATGL